MKNVFGLVTLFLLVLVSGCNTVGEFFTGKDNSDPPAKLVKMENSLAVQTLWSKDVGVGTNESYIKLSPRVVGDKIFAADRKGRVTAYDKATGKSLWEINMKKTPISGGVGSGEGLVLVGTSEGDVIALDESNGKELWRSSVTSEILAVPRAANGIVVVRTVDGKLFGLNAKEGKRVWVYDSSVPVLTLRGASSPVLVGDKIIDGLPNGKLVALSLNEGKLLWEVKIAESRGRTEIERLVDINDPQVTGDTIYVTSFQGRVAAVALDSGRLLWARDMSSHAGVGVDENNLYVADDQGNILALSQSDGRTVWKQDKLHARAVSGPAVYGNYVVAGDFEGYLHWLAVDDGHFVAREKIDKKGIIATPIATDDAVYVSGKGGILAALRANK